jgi:hypothetical protein
MGLWTRFKWSRMCVVTGLSQQDNGILSCLIYNNHFSDKRLLSSKAWLCSMRLVIAMFYLFGYFYVLFGWLLLCSICLVIVKFYLVGNCFARIPQCLNFWWCQNNFTEASLWISHERLCRLTFGGTWQALSKCKSAKNYEFNTLIT